jgi:hypothetical protein
MTQTLAPTPAAAGLECLLDLEPHPDEPQQETWTAHDMVGRRFMRKGQELYCAYVERDTNAPPNACFALNFTKGYKKTRALVAKQDWGPETLHWQNAERNLPFMQNSLDTLPKKKIVYCVGSGPCLMRNWRWLEEAKKNPHATVLGCNELLQYLPAGLLEYYTAMDAGSPDRWWQDKDLSQTTAILGSFVSPGFATAPWKKALWYRMGYHNRLNSMVANRRGHLSIVNPLYGVGPGELELAWHFKPEVVVLVGHGYTYDMVDGIIYEHINEPLTEDRWEGALRGVNVFFTEDINAKPVATDYHILITSMMALTCCQILQDAGVRVINASEGGILRSNQAVPAYRDRPSFPERMKLEEVVRELA